MTNKKTMNYQRILVIIENWKVPTLIREQNYNCVQYKLYLKNIFFYDKQLVE